MTRLLIIIVLVLAAAGTFVVVQTLTGEGDASRREADRSGVDGDLEPRVPRRAEPPAEKKPQRPGSERRYAVFGFVTDVSGDAVVGARVTASPVGAQGPRTVTTDRDGRYELALDYYRLAFDVAAVGYLPVVGTSRGLSNGRVEFIVEGNEPNRRDFLLARGAVLAGRVTGPAGAPVAGASVYRIDAEHQLVDEPSLANVTLTNDRGEYAFPGLQDGTLDLGVRAPGFLPALVHDVKIEGLHEVRRDFTLERGREVSARVAFDAQGHPLRAMVVAADSRLRAMLLPPGGRELLQDALPGRAFLEMPVVTAMRGPDGVAKLVGLPAGPVDIEAQVVLTPSRVRVRQWIAEPGTGKLLDNSDPEVALRPILAGLVAITVVDAQSRKPLAPTITRTADGAGPFPIDVEIEGERYWVPLDARRHVLKFALNAYLDADFVLPAQRDNPYEVAVEMQPVADSATGGLRIVFDRPLKGRVGVVGRGEGRARQWYAKGPDKQGRWVVAGIPPGVWDFTILASGMVPAKAAGVTVIAGTTQEITVGIMPGGGMELRVEGPDGKLLDKVTIDLRDENNERIDIHFVTMVSGQRGFTSINYIPSAATGRADSGFAVGAYTLYAARTGYEFGKSGFVIHATEVAKVTVRLEKK